METIPSSSPCDVPFQCPECGGKLWAEIEQWEEETGTVTECGFKLYCTTEEAEQMAMVSEDDESEFSHRWWQSDWQPIIDKVHKWMKKNIRVQ